MHPVPNFVLVSASCNPSTAALRLLKEGHHLGSCAGKYNSDQGEL